MVPTSSTPKGTRMSHLEVKLYKLTAENEQLQFELKQVHEENAKLRKTIAENEEHMNRLKKGIDTVSQIAIQVYNGFLDFKHRHQMEKLMGSNS